MKFNAWILYDGCDVDFNDNIFSPLIRYFRIMLESQFLCD